MRTRLLTRCLDPAAIDGGLQLATLWAKHAIGAATQPQSIRECLVRTRGPVNGPVRCLVLRRRTSALDADGEPRVELVGVQLVARPQKVQH